MSSPRVDFYLLERTEPQAVLHFACRLIRKLQQQQKGAFIWAESPAQASALDDLLWTFSDESFIPHLVVHSSSPNRQAPVHISTELAHSSTFEIVLSLNQQQGTTLPSTPRIAEIISADKNIKQLSRKRYAQYRDKDFKIEVHPIPQ